jgi:hypothetical protein
MVHIKTDRKANENLGQSGNFIQAQTAGVLPVLYRTFFACRSKTSIDFTL